MNFFLAISSGLRKGVVEDIKRRLKDLQLKNRGNREDDIVFVMPRCDPYDFHSIRLCGEMASRLTTISEFVLFDLCLGHSSLLKT